MMNATVAAPVATLWARPDSPRPGLDAAALGPCSSPRSWVDGLDDAGRMYTGILTQLLHGEPVLIEEVRDGWARVVATAQPAAKLDPRGYPGWLPLDQLTVRDGDPATAFDPAAAVPVARAWLGVPYVWGGLSPYGIDCSGLVHLAFRQVGVVLPRDADDQFHAAEPVELGQEQPGDLYFFGGEQRSSITHVGFVTAPPADGGRRMLHACGDGGRVVEEVMPAPRVATLVGAGRVRLSPPA
ncbi:C40 family peptidase [Catellatospora sp. KI3]|uniref:C40 family peptidase n=1 Tax=Catellatospora sp. KI3 TaxID=3041620 RepID=UPI002482B12D|nr:C40 family peptidase [Catellatospora sp. KI3]MDI1465439.1 C40 family peptidase [Catellatospora sp. KI3]